MHATRSREDCIRPGRSSSDTRSLDASIAARMSQASSASTAPSTACIVARGAFGLQGAPSAPLKTWLKKTTMSSVEAFSLQGAPNAASQRHETTLPGLSARGQTAIPSLLAAPSACKGAAFGLERPPTAAAFSLFMADGLQPAFRLFMHSACRQSWCGMAATWHGRNGSD
jgi:hypothetical protein